MFNRKFIISAGLVAMLGFALAATLLTGGVAKADQATKPTVAQVGPGNGGDGSGKPQPGPSTNRYYDSTAAAAALQQANADLQLAQGAINSAASAGVDTSVSAGLVAKAGDLYNQATSFNTSGDYYRAGSYASASDLASSAAASLALGSITPGPVAPAVGPKPGESGPPTGSGPGNTITQEMAANQLSKDYSEVAAISNEVSAQANAADYAYYITTAQSIYSQAYNAYQAGSYDQAFAISPASSRTARVADLLIGAEHPATAPSSPQPPAPNFGK